MNPLARRLTGAFGVIFAVAQAASLVAATGSPPTESDGQSIERFVLSHYHALQVSLALQVVAVLFFCLFAGGLAGMLRRADEATGDSWAPAFTIGAAGSAVLLAGAAAAQGAYQEMTHSGAIPEQVQALFRLSNDLTAASGLFLAVLLAAVGTSAVLNGVMPVPIASIGLFVGLVGLVGAGALGTTRNALGTVVLVAVVLFEVWVAAVSLWLLLWGPGEDLGPPFAGALGPEE